MKVSCQLSVHACMCALEFVSACVCVRKKLTEPLEECLCADLSAEWWQQIAATDWSIIGPSFLVQPYELDAEAVLVRMFVQVSRIPLISSALSRFPDQLMSFNCVKEQRCILNCHRRSGFFILFFFQVIFSVCLVKSRCRGPTHNPAVALWPSHQKNRHIPNKSLHKFIKRWRLN